MSPCRGDVVTGRIPRSPHRHRGGGLAAVLCLTVALPTLAADAVDVFTQDFERFARLTASSEAELRLEGVIGFEWLRHFSAESYLTKLANDPAPEVRREVAYALSRVGRRASIPVLFGLLADGDPNVRQQAALSLKILTQTDDPALGGQWATDPDAYEQALIEGLASPDTAQRIRSLKGLLCFGAEHAEQPVLVFVTSGNPAPDGYQLQLAASVLERVGGPASLPWLCGAAEWLTSAAWALGQIGGPAAEEALLKGLTRNGVWDQSWAANLDRLRSTRCGPLVPMLVGSYGCITYRGQPEDLTYDPTPLQRLCTNLVIRSGRAPEVVEFVLREMEGHCVDDEITEDLRPAMVALRQELMPGFVRNDGLTTSQPMCAMSQLVSDRTLAPRLIPLLQHPAFVARVYAAVALGRLGAVEAVPAITEVIHQGYPFADAVTAVSGKHFQDSQTVRWKGFLCMALGRIGGEDARLVLERMATDPDEYRDIRYGAVVGLGFIGSPESLPALRKVAADDIIWCTQVEARDVAHRIELAEKGGLRP